MERFLKLPIWFRLIVYTVLCFGTGWASGTLVKSCVGQGNGVAPRTSKNVTVRHMKQITATGSSILKDDGLHPGSHISSDCDVSSCATRKSSN